MTIKMVTYITPLLKQMGYDIPPHRAIVSENTVRNTILSQAFSHCEEAVTFTMVLS